MGSCVYLLKEAWKLSEYECAAYYGRPLFALMMEKGILAIANRDLFYVATC
jgi:hypothetical protein